MYLSESCVAGPQRVKRKQLYFLSFSSSPLFLLLLQCVVPSGADFCERNVNAVQKEKGSYAVLLEYACDQICQNHTSMEATCVRNYVLKHIYTEVRAQPQTDATPAVNTTPWILFQNS